MLNNYLNNHFKPTLLLTHYCFYSLQIIVNLGDRELSAMMNKNWTQVNAPLLVLSTVSQPDTPALSCAAVVELLQLRQFNRPWQVNILTQHYRL